MDNLSTKHGNISFYLAILYSDKTSMKISKKFSNRLVLSKAEGKHRALRAKKFSAF